ncbi:hypothetical protein NQ317_013290 [Molorchus minor]|uniref:Actin maturation protease n=1 Tax=Molorchus minor TaxID=1323400 RepID=A0ABQ9JSW2_9CUCU|nr:hypothetical protein NQ317_013290 [Molorchus minor]
MDYSWAEPFPEVYKVCTLFQMTEISSPIQYHYKPLLPYLQDGPQCGLVALAMCMGMPNEKTVKMLYKSALSQSYTCNGEIFSTRDMADLARQHIKKEVTVDVFNGDLNDIKIKQFLLDGGFILVPYDTNKDNSPGLHCGHKAHWAAVSGGIETEDNFFILARHGKARNVAIWRLTDLAKSNNQLHEFSPDRRSHNIEYKLPDGGIDGPLGLNKKSVLIKFL